MAATSRTTRTTRGSRRRVPMPRRTVSASITETPASSARAVTSASGRPPTCAPVRVAGEQQVVAARGRLGRAVGGVHHRDAEALGRGPRYGAEVVAADVRVVEAEEFHREVPEADVAPDVREVLPSVGGEEPHEVCAPAPRSAPGAAEAVRDEVAQGVRGARHVVVVRAEDEPRGEPSARRAHEVDGALDGLRFREEVTRDDGHVGRRQRGEEPRLRRVAAHDVEVREVEDREGRGAARR